MIDTINAKIVLAIDDNTVQLREYNVFLGSRYDVRTVKTAAVALRFLNTNPADIVLLDVEMPDISGFDLLSEIRKIPCYTSVPVVIVSGKTGADIYEKAKKFNVFDVLIKPVQADTLIKTIEKALV